MEKIVSVERSSSEAPSDRVRLDHDQRTRRRMLYTTENGATILLDMPRAVRLRDGDGLRLEGGAVVRVEAIPEALIEIAAGSTAALVRIAWHLGNRHLPTQLLAGPDGGTLRIRHDHVIVEMVEGLGGRCQPVLAPFDPEGGAYAGAGGSAGHHGHHGHGGEHG
jgi:urease accessory protein